MTFKWTNSPIYLDMIDFIENDEFFGDYWSNHRLIKHKYQINGYLATLNNDTKYVAQAVVGWLSETKTLHIEFFSIDSSIEGKNLSRAAWNSLLDFVQKELDITSIDDLLIESYFKNVKIMCVDPHIDDNIKNIANHRSVIKSNL